MPCQPLGKVLFCVVGNAGDKRAQPAAYGQLVGKRKRQRAQKSRHIMQRRGQKGGLKDAPAPTRLYEGKSIEPADCLAYPEAAIKIDEVDAVTQQHVLAVVDHLSRSRVLVGGSAATEVGTALEEGDAKARFGKGAGSGQSGETAAGNGYCGLSWGLSHAVLAMLDDRGKWRRRKYSLMQHTKKQYPHRPIARLGTIKIIRLNAAGSLFPRREVSR